MKKKIQKKNVFVFLVLISMAILICGTANMNPFIEQKKHVDSTVFQYIGNAIKDGQLPYRDIFDHKGPVLYLINYIGILFSGDLKIGIWIIEVIFMTITFRYMYKIAKLFTESDIVSTLAVIISVIPLYKLFQGGNLVEEYALPFIAISLYYMIKYLVKTKTISKKESFVIGICMSLVLLLRPNMISLYIVYCLIIFIDMIKRKKYKQAKDTVIFFLLGMFIILAICLIFFIKNGILEDFINQYIIFNFKYSGNGLSESIFECIIYFLFEDSLIILDIVICIINIIYKKVKKEENIIVPLSVLIYIIFSIIIMAIPKRCYEHYEMILIPIGIVPILIAFEMLKNKEKKIIIISCLVLLLCSIPSIKAIYEGYTDKKDITQEYEDMIQEIQKISNIDDKIIVIGNECSIYLKSNRKSAIKYIYQEPIANIDDKIRQEVITGIENSDAKLIVYNRYRIKNIEESHIIQTLEKLIENKKYKKIFGNKKYVILEKNQM